MFTRSVSPEQAPDKPTYIEMDFEKGDPVAINGVLLSPATLLAQLNKVSQLPLPLPSLGHGEYPLLFHTAKHSVGYSKVSGLNPCYFVTLLSLAASC
jgi:hypothetical protein